MDKGHCDAAEILKGARLSRTPQRDCILNILLQAEKPLNARNILENCTDRKINRVTVYRIMESFKKQGIVRELPTDSGIKYFEIACRHNPLHPHFFCKDCGAMACLGPLTLTEAWDLFAHPHAFRIDEIVVNITGLCKDCSSK